MRRLRFWLVLIPSILLGLVFLTSGIGKLLGYGAFLMELNAMGYLPLWVSTATARVLPPVEIALGLALLAGICVQPAALASAVLFVGFGFSNAWLILHGYRYKPCGCLGIFEDLLQGKLSTENALYADIGLFILAVIIYIAFQGKVFNLRPWYLNRNGGEKA